MSWTPRTFVSKATLNTLTAAAGVPACLVVFGESVVIVAAFWPAADHIIFSLRRRCKVMSGSLGDTKTVFFVYTERLAAVPNTKSLL